MHLYNLYFNKSFLLHILINQSILRIDICMFGTFIFLVNYSIILQILNMFFSKDLISIYGNITFPIKHYSVVVSTGSLFWIKEGDIVFIFSDSFFPLTGDNLIDIMHKLIFIKIQSVIFVNCKPTNDVLTLYEMESISYINILSIADFYNNNCGISKSGMLNQLKYNLIDILGYKKTSTKHIIYLIHLITNDQCFLMDSNKNILYGHYSDIDINSLLDNDKIKYDSDYSTYSEANYINQYIYFMINISPYDAYYLYIKKPNDDSLNFNLSIKELLPYLLSTIALHKYSMVISKDSMNDFIESILFGLENNGNNIKLKSTKFNLNYYQNRFVWILDIDIMDGTNKSFLNIEDILHMTKSFFPENIFLIQHFRIISIHKNTYMYVDKLQSLFKSLFTDIEKKYPNSSISIGFSRTYASLIELKDAYIEACFALKLYNKLLKNKEDKEIPFYNSILIYHLIYEQIRNPIVSKIYQNTIEIIKEFDLKNSDGLLLTLETLVKNNFSYEKTSKNLFIHRNTLYQRIKRIESIIHMPFKDINTSVILQLGVIIGEIYKTEKKN